MTLTKTQREAILTKIQSLVTEKYFDPSFNEAAWQEIVRRNRAAIVAASDTSSSEAAVSKMLAELSPKTLGLLSDHTPINSRNAINASFSVEAVGTGLRWVFQDVLPGGVAARAGLRPGDTLLSAAGKPLQPASRTPPNLRLKCTKASQSLSRGAILLKRFPSPSKLPRPNTRTILTQNRQP